jgi:hypothetical protein
MVYTGAAQTGVPVHAQILPSGLPAVERGERGG